MDVGRHPAMSDVAVCDICGTSDLEMVVQHGSYALACKDCGNGPATSFVAIAPLLTSLWIGVQKGPL